MISLRISHTRISHTQTANGKQVCGAFDFQFAHPSMRFLPVRQRWPNFANFEHGLRGVGEANWVTIIPAIPPIAASQLSSSRFAREYLQDDPRP